jgi:hypothetical protein
MGWSSLCIACAYIRIIHSHMHSLKPSQNRCAKSLSKICTQTHSYTVNTTIHILNEVSAVSVIVKEKIVTVKCVTFARLCILSSSSGAHRTWQ